MNDKSGAEVEVGDVVYYADSPQRRYSVMKSDKSFTKLNRCWGRPVKGRDPAPIILVLELMLKEATI